MNIVSVFIWVLIVLFSVTAAYYNKKMFDNYVSRNVTKVVPSSLSPCQYPALKNTSVSTYSKCKINSGIQSFRFGNYEISPGTPFSPDNVCTGLCVSGVASSGDCSSSVEQTERTTCLKLLTPKSGCSSISNPLAVIGNTYYYARAPINSLNTC